MKKNQDIGEIGNMKKWDATSHRNFVFGFPDNMKPISGLPDTNYYIRFNPGQYASIYRYIDRSIRRGLIGVDDNGNWNVVWDWGHPLSFTQEKEIIELIITANKL